MLYLGAMEQEDTAAIDWRKRFESLAHTALDPRLQAFYTAGVVKSETPLANVPFVALDFETTGLDPQQHAIISMGLVPFNLRRIYYSQGRHWLIKPRKPMTEETIPLHGITPADLADAPDLMEVLEPLLQQLAGQLVVVHYRGIERAFLDAAVRKRLGEGIEFPVVDTMQLEALRHRQPLKNLFNRLRQRKPLSIRLSDSRARYGLPYYPPHHALTDALATAELLQAQVAYHFSEDTSIADLWC